MPYYIEGNPKSKAEVKRMIKAGKPIRVFNPGLGGEAPYTGKVYELCGPHFPAPHKWYGNGEMKSGLLVKIS